MTRPAAGILTSPLGPYLEDKVSIVVVNWQALPFLDRCLRSIVEHTSDEIYELVVVDNGSTDGSGKYLRHFRPRGAAGYTLIANPDNRHFSAAFNQGFNAAAADSRYLAVFCNDVEAKSSGWLRTLLDAVKQPGVVAAGRALRQPLPDEHRRIYLEARPRYADPGLEARVRGIVEDPDADYAHLDGYCFLLDKQLLSTSGLYLTGGPFRQYHSDWELYLRFQALGYRVVNVLADVHHWHGISELIAFHPDRYQELLTRIADASVLESYLQHGRELFPEESGFHAWRVAKEPE